MKRIYIYHCIGVPYDMNMIVHTRLWNFRVLDAMAMEVGRLWTTVATTQTMSFCVNSFFFATFLLSTFVATITHRNIKEKKIKEKKKQYRTYISLLLFTASSSSLSRVSRI